jgi:hypothetical protein
MSTETDRTLFFDFMPMELGTIAGQKVRVQLYTVPGQVFYDATRKLVLRGADGVVFVADSQASMKESNLDSLANLKTNLRINRIDPDKIAIVFQYNKRDLPNVSSVEEMNAYLQPGSAPVVEAAAISGNGVTATLRAAIARILDNLKGNVDTVLHEEPPLAAPDMKQRSGVTTHSAGVPKLSMRGEPASAPPPPAPLDNPFDTGDVAVTVEAVAEEDPFATLNPDNTWTVATAAVAESEPFADVVSVDDAPAFIDVAPDDLFAAEAAEPAPVHDERADLEEMLANARALVASLETALERARETERKLAGRLERQH